MAAKLQMPSGAGKPAFDSTAANAVFSPRGKLLIPAFARNLQLPPQPAAASLIL